MPKKSFAQKPNKVSSLPSLQEGARITFRIDFASEKALGPGKVRLLELVAECGSITAAGKAMDMSYRRAWLLIDDLNHLFKEPLVITRQGGKGGGQTELTATGKAVIEHYRAMEQDAKNAFSSHLQALEDLR